MCRRAGPPRERGGKSDKKADMAFKYLCFHGMDGQKYLFVDNLKNCSQVNRQGQQWLHWQVGGTYCERWLQYWNREEFLKFTSNLPLAKREKLLENLDRYLFAQHQLMANMKNDYTDIAMHWLFGFLKKIQGMGTDVTVRRSSEPCFTWRLDVFKLNTFVKVSNVSHEWKIIIIQIYSQWWWFIISR